MAFDIEPFRESIETSIFRPQHWIGDRVLAFGRVSLYDARGHYQLIVDEIEPAGTGALKREFDRLKRKLEAEGLFDPADKQPLPRCIGVVTSPSGAAELVVPDAADLLQLASSYASRLARLGRRALEDRAQTVDWLARRLRVASPAGRPARQRDRLNSLSGRLGSAALHDLLERDQRLQRQCA